MEQAPSPGEVSSDGQFVWDGRRWAPLSEVPREPAEANRRMQLLAGGYLLAAGLLTALLTFFAEPYVRQATEKALRAQNQGMTSEQLKAIVDISVTVGIAVAVLIGLVYIAFGILTLFRPWAWLFYADLVILGLSGLGVVTGLFGVTRGNTGPLGLAIPNLVLSAAALVLFIWMLMTRIQGGVWGARKFPTP
jgi:hypothetical protein